MECKLGSTAELSYKLEFAQKLLTDTTRIGGQETGVLDLSYADTHNAGFLAGPIELEDCTRLDLTDLYDIRLWYQDRVECKLGRLLRPDRPGGRR